MHRASRYLFSTYRVPPNSALETSMPLPSIPSVSDRTEDSENQTRRRPTTSAADAPLCGIRCALAPASAASEGGGRDGNDDDDRAAAPRTGRRALEVGEAGETGDGPRRGEAEGPLGKASGRPRTPPTFAMGRCGR